MKRTVTVARELVPSLSRVDVRAERDAYWKELLGAWSAPKRFASHHPGSNPVSISRKHLPQVEASEYLIANKSDGVRYTLFLTCRPESDLHNPAPVALMIDRARNMYEIELVAPEAYFVRRTILEGELVWRQPREEGLMFIVFDAILIQGELLTAKPFAQRIKRACACLNASEHVSRLMHEKNEIETHVLQEDTIVCTHYEPSIIFRVKVFVSNVHAERLWSERAECEHRVDGIILQCAKSTYCFGTAYRGAAFKWKPHVTVDLAGVQRSGIDGALPREHRGCVVRVDETSRIAPQSDDDIVEYSVSHCSESGESGEIVLFAVRRRPDKQTSNGLNVIHAAFDDVMDSIAVSELAGQNRRKPRR